MPVKMVKGPEPVRRVQRRMVRSLYPILEKQGAHHIREREKVIRTWKREKPVFKNVQKTRIGKGLSMEIRLAGSDKGRKKYIWVGFGTKRRFAHMTRFTRGGRAGQSNFIAKTRVGVIRSFKGRGGFSHLGPPLPGIKARDWDRTIINKNKFKEARAIITAVAQSISGDSEGPVRIGGIRKGIRDVG